MGRRANGQGAWRGAVLGLSMLAAGAVTATGAAAQDRRTLGFVVVSTNDDYLDTEILDRWRSGALSAHLVRGTGWTGVGEVGFGDVVEYRFRGEIITPEDVDNPRPGDRPYAGTLAFGVHGHMRRGVAEIRLGADIFFTGPQTGLSDLQERLHERLNLPDPSIAAEDQIGDAVYLAVSGEVARGVPVGGGSLLLRPFGEARAGDETFARLGVDVLGGSLASGGLLLRDYATGQLIEGTRGARTGFGWSVGLDVAAVAGSVYLPDEDGFPGPEDTRSRARAGVMWAGETWSAFAGTSYLGEEFEGQGEGQVVGAVGVTFGF